MSRNTRRRAHLRPLHSVLAGVAVCALVVGFMAMAYIAPRGVPLTGAKTLYATLPDSGNLRVHSEARLDGVRVGEVVKVSPRYGRALVRLRIDPGKLSDIRAGTTAAVRGQGLLGARYIALQLGRSGQQIAEGATLQASRAPFTLGVGDALETFDRSTRGGLHSVLGELGRGLVGRGSDVNGAIGSGATMTRDASSLIDAVMSRSGAVGRLVPSLHSGSAAMDAARHDIVAVVQPVRRGLEPFVDRARDFRATLSAVPPALAAARPALDDGRKLLAAASSLARASRRTLRRAPRGLDAVARFFAASPRPLARATTLVDDAHAAVPDVLRLTRAIRPVLKPAGAAFADLTRATSALADHACDLKAWGGNWRDFVNHGIAGGAEAGGGAGIGPLTALRFEPIFSAESVAGVGSNEGLLGEDTDSYAAPCKYPPHTYATGSYRR